MRLGPYLVFFAFGLKFRFAIVSEDLQPQDVHSTTVLSMFNMLALVYQTLGLIVVSLYTIPTYIVSWYAAIVSSLPLQPMDDVPINMADELGAESTADVANMESRYAERMQDMAGITPKSLLKLPSTGPAAHVQNRSRSYPIEGISSSCYK